MNQREIRGWREEGTFGESWKVEETRQEFDLPWQETRMLCKKLSPPQNPRMHCRRSVGCQVCKRHHQQAGWARRIETSRDHIGSRFVRRPLAPFLHSSLPPLTGRAGHQGRGGRNGEKLSLCQCLPSLQIQGVAVGGKEEMTIPPPPLGSREVTLSKIHSLSRWNELLNNKPGSRPSETEWQLIGKLHSLSHISLPVDIKTGANIKLPGKMNTLF